MFTITFEDEVFNSWSCDFIFNSLDDAQWYLEQQGFIQKDRFFERIQYGWSEYVKAWILPRKVYSSSVREVIKFDIPIQGKENCDKQNKMSEELFGKGRFTPIKPTEDHMEDLFSKVFNAIYDVAEKGGNYLGDGVRVKVELEYDAENK